MPAPFLFFASTITLSLTGLRYGDIIPHVEYREIEMKIPSALFLFMALAASPAAASVSVDTTGLMAWYPFSGNAGDSSGHGFHGVLHGPTLCPDRFGNLNAAYDFDGINDYITLVPSTALGLPNHDFTVLAWIKGRSFLVNNDRTIVGNNTGVGNNSVLHIVVREFHPYMDFNYNGMAGYTQMVAEQWYHLAYRYTASSGEMAIFVNGILDRAETGHTAYIGSDTVFIGKWHYGYHSTGSTFMDGVLDDIMIFTRALTQAEIFTLASGTAIDAPVLISPEDGSSLPELIFPAFVWHAVDSAAYYRFQLASSTSFSSTSLIEDFTLSDTTTMPVLAPQGSGPYWWRVTAHNGPYSRTSETWTFGFWKPILISPPRDTVFSTWNTPSFLWHSEDSADYYRLWVAKDAGFTNIVINHALLDTQYAPAGPLADGHYWWKVKAYGAEYLEPFQSETRFFAVNLYGGVTGEPAVPAPERLGLAPPCPDPANSTVKLSWEQPIPGNGRLEIYNVTGKRVKILHDGQTGKGVHVKNWDLRDEAGKRVPNGVYFFRLRTGETEDVKRLTVVR